MKIPRNAINNLIEILLTAEARKATKYLSETFVIRASRRMFKAYKNGFSKNDKIVEIVLTIGNPNYEEREFIKKCKKVGEKFPIKKVQLKFYKNTKIK